jgi:hypothetical protein
MDLTKYINENLDEILDNTDEYIVTSKPNKVLKPVKLVSWKEEIEEKANIVDTRNEDEPTNEEIQDELFQDYYDKKLQKEYLKSIGQPVPDSDDEKTEEEIEEEQSQYRLKLLNLFLVHYNEKFDKQENYFSNIKNVEKDTSNPMELFFEVIIEFKKLKEILELEDDEDCIKYWFEDSDDKNIDMMFTKFPEGQMYCLDYNGKRIISPSLLICLNYLVNNKDDLFENKNWHIFSLRDY